jgi:radical SAM superfamily enzyme YgiQ (UPF0313 family)
MRRKTAVLFLQLPQLDTDVAGPHENVMLAAAHLQYAAECAGEGRYHDFARLAETMGDADNAHLADEIGRLRPGIVAFTVYLWNVERTLRLAALIKRRWPGVRVIAGGPEVAFPHPFLFRARTIDVAVAGEGEAVFPLILKALRSDAALDFRTVATLAAHGYRRGRREPPPVELISAAPPPGYQACAPDARGMAYMEASRGCPMRCAYCRYPQLRRRLSFLEPDAVLARIAAFGGMGVREIRFVDPSFNAHPRLTDLLRGIAAINRSKAIAFFAEINVERLDREQARLLASANFREIEVGMQTRDPGVLRAIRRPSLPARFDAGVRALTREGVRVTLDVMYGLPLQTMADVRASLNHAARFPGVNVQSLQTLLLPGTELRRRSREWNLRADPLPPYGVTATSALSAQDLRRIEERVSRHHRLRSDLPTPVFVGRRLPALFSEQVRIAAERLDGADPVPGRTNRRAVRIQGSNLLQHRAAISGFVERALRAEPDLLWQFVLELKSEEPLDVLDDLIAAIRKCPPHLLDRYAAPACEGRIASRRVLVHLKTLRGIRSGWIKEAERTLRNAFF